MAGKKRHWFWNIIMVVTLIMCILAFMAHYKNWSRFKNGEFEILTGIYYQKILDTELNEVQWALRIPKMERRNGFSAIVTEKGVFNDSITGHKVYVFVDDLAQRKIHLTYQDSLHLYLNYSDSLLTEKHYVRFEAIIDSLNSKNQ